MSRPQYSRMESASLFHCGFPVFAGAARLAQINVRFSYRLLWSDEIPKKIVQEEISNFDILIFAHDVFHAVLRSVLSIETETVADTLYLPNFGRWSHWRNKLPSVYILQRRNLLRERERNSRKLPIANSAQVFRLVLFL